MIRTTLILLTGLISFSFTAKASANDVFVERKVLLYPSCRDSSKLPETGENLAIIALNDVAAVNEAPCDRACMNEKRYGVADVKNFPVLKDLLAELKRAPAKPGTVKADSLVAFPDIGVCIFIDSIKSEAEFQGKIYRYSAPTLQRLRDSVRPSMKK